MQVAHEWIGSRGMGAVGVVSDIVGDSDESLLNSVYDCGSDRGWEFC